MNFCKCFLLFLISFNCFAKADTNISKYESLGLLWGFLKYHQPEVSKGNYRWDQEFVSMLGKVEQANCQNELNTLYKNWILSLGKVPTIKPETYGKNIITKNEDYAWFDNYGFDDELKVILISLKSAKHKAGDYYASRDKMNKFINHGNEKALERFSYKNKAHRLLTLFSFWNAMQYYNIHKYTFDKNWNDVLTELLPVFANANSEAAYQMAKAKLFRYIDDSHTDVYYKKMNDSLFPYSIPVGLFNVNDTLLVYSTQNKEALENNGIKVGDVIVAIDNKSIAEVIQEEIAPYHSCSNANVLKRYSYLLGYSRKEFAEYSVLKPDGKTEKHRVQFYKEPKKGTLDVIKTKPFSNYPNDVAYLSLQNATEKAVDSFFAANKDKKGIILDLRRNPKHAIEERLAYNLYAERKTFVKVMGSLGVPGLSEYDLQAPLKIINDPFKAGGTNKNYYKGKVVVLVDRNTQSRMEYIALMLQQSPNCITIGEQTAGVFMNIIEYKLPDGESVYYTGMEAFYPDDTSAFKKGVRLDKVVKQSAINYDPNLYVKEAIKIIQQ